LKELEPNRLQFLVPANDRMIQVQQTRFVLNWLKGERDYPRYSKLRDEFRKEYERFAHFLAAAGLGAPEPNQWEVTYVNHLVRGQDWEQLEDCEGFFPALRLPPSLPELTRPDAISLDWTYVVQDGAGRLRVQFRLAKHKPTGDEVVRIKLTARGPLEIESGTEEILERFDLGRRAIVGTFVAASTSEAHQRWGRLI
jgi:uncharacterized protein (TIGR04255 family)